MLNFDCIQHIIINSDYATTLAFLQTCSYFASNSNIWKLKYQFHYPSKPYFDFWSSKENYLVNSKNKFFIEIGFRSMLQYPKYISEYVYEYPIYATFVFT